MTGTTFLPNESILLLLKGPIRNGEPIEISQGDYSDDHKWAAALSESETNPRPFPAGAATIYMSHRVDDDWNPCDKHQIILTDDPV